MVREMPCFRDFLQKTMGLELDKWCDSGYICEIEMLRIYF